MSIVSILLIVVLLIGLVILGFNNSRTRNNLDEVISILTVEQESNLCALKSWKDFNDSLAGKNGLEFTQSLEAELDETFEFDPENRNDFSKQAESIKRHIIHLGFKAAADDITEFVDDLSVCKQALLEGNIEVFEQFNPSSKESDNPE